MFPLADARGRVIGFQARKLHDDDPLKGKYVNSPESELFKKSNVLYGLHLARPAIAKQDRAVVVEGNTDVIALRQAGFEPVVASMGTALTEHHLRELARLTKRLYLCFDADAAGEEATLRGMERAHGAGLRDPRSSCCRRARTRPMRPTASSSGSARPRATFTTASGSSSSAPPTGRRHSSAPARSSPRPRTRPSARRRVRLVADRLDLPRETLSGIAPARGAAAAPAAARSRRSCSTRASGSSARRSPPSSRIRTSRDALAGLGEEHFDLEEHRRMRALTRRRQRRRTPISSPLLAELDATASSEGITRRTGTEMLLRLRERKLRRDLQGETDLARATELQAHLAKVRQALTELA